MGKGSRPPEAEKGGKGTDLPRPLRVVFVLPRTNGVCKDWENEGKQNET